MRSKLFALFAASLFFSFASAQQDPQYTMYMFNRFAINPAYAGALQATNITGLGRAQWVGIPGAPRTSTISINGYVDKLHGGIGAYIIGDRLGPIETFGIKAAYAFNINFGDKAYLNIGAQGGVYQKTLDGTEWEYKDKDNSPDPILQDIITTQTLPDLDAGIYFRIPLKSASGSAYPQDRFFLGGSVSHILEPNLDQLVNTTATILPRTIQGMAGFTFDLGNNIYLQPGGNFRMTGPNMQWDINANLYVSPMVFGVSHRWEDSFSGIVGFNASTSLFVAYAYDFTTSGLGGFTTGSHEVVVSYTFPSKFVYRPARKGVIRSGDGIF